MNSFTDYAENFKSKIGKSEIRKLPIVNQNFKYYITSPNSVGNELVNINSNKLVINKFEVSPNKSCRSKLSKFSPMSRKDVLGTPIVRGKKKHRVTFQDNLGGSPLVNIAVIESFKAFNAMNTYNEKKTNEKDEVSSDCCVIL